MRGMRGGLCLARAADQINVGQVIRRLEPDMALVPCLHPVDAPCPIVPSCRLRGAMEQAGAAFLAVLDTYTIADLAAPRDSLRVILNIGLMVKGIDPRRCLRCGKDRGVGRTTSEDGMSLILFTTPRLSLKHLTT